MAEPTSPTLPAFTPVPRQRQHHNGWTPQRQRDFVEALALTGNVEASAQRVGMTRESAYQLRRAPGAEEFAAAWAQALDFGVTRLEDLAIDRAINGVQVPVYSYGKLIGSRTVYNDRLLMFILRQRRPDRYGHSAAHKSALDVETLRIAARKALDEQRATRAAEARTAANADPMAGEPSEDQLVEWLRESLDAVEAAMERGEDWACGPKHGGEGVGGAGKMGGVWE